MINYFDKTFAEYEAGFESKGEGLHHGTVALQIRQCTRVAEVGSLSARAKMGIQISVKRVYV